MRVKLIYIFIIFAIKPPTLVLPRCVLTVILTTATYHLKNCFVTRHLFLEISKMRPTILPIQV